VPASIVKNFKEALEDPQMVDRKMIVEADHPVFGRQKMLRNPVLMDHDGPDVRYAAPLLGQHSAEILSEMGFTAAEIKVLADAGTIRLHEEPAERSVA
jgi:crotonobetainyl-CoA:carnitine CoA-transferase CaiB-like acyl-CoA transferase